MSPDMRLEPHENLTLWASRHLHYWHRWFQDDPPCRDQAQPIRIIHHTHHHHRDRVTLTCPQVEVRVVEHTHKPEPADIHPAWLDGYAQRDTTPAVSGNYTPSAWPHVVTARPIDTADTPAPFPMAQDFVFGQAVPATGGLIDIFA